MTPTLMTLALITTVAVGLLSFFLAGLAIRHDKLVEAAPYADELFVLERRIQEARDSLADINGQIDARREAMEQIAGREAEVDALNRMHQEILDEINRLDDRREEIRQLDLDTEEAVAKFAEARRDLDQAEEQLQAVQARLDRAEALTGTIADLEEQETRLNTDVTNLRSELGDMRQLQEQEGHLRENLDTLRREEARLDGTKRAAEERLATVSTDVAATEEQRAEAEREVAQLMAERVGTYGEVLKLEEARATLEARNAKLRGDNGIRDGTGSTEADPLQDLKIMPVVLQPPPGTGNPPGHRRAGCASPCQTQSESTRARLSRPHCPRLPHGNEGQ